MIACNLHLVILERNYELEVDDDVVIDAITIKSPSYWYVLIDGKLFKSDSQKGLKSILFSSRERAENAVNDGLYWKHKIVYKSIK